jgi:hypothetical protein
MRRRRPSALYSVLDEEQLLGGVDLADHPDPRAGEGRTGRGPEDCKDWSAGEWAEWDPDEADGPLDWSRGDAGDPELVARGERSSPRAHGSSVATRRRRLALGTLGALIVILLVSRGIGSILAGAGEPASSRRAPSGPAVGALSAMSRDSASAASARPAPARAHSYHDSPPVHRPRAHGPHLGPATGRPRWPGNGVANPKRSAESPPRLVGDPQTAQRRSSTSQRMSSPEQEFGFER